MSIIEKIEHFNPDTLNCIIQNMQELVDQKKLNSDHTALLSSYLNKSRYGKVKVEYRQKNGDGRYFALRGLSLQVIPGIIRRTIAGHNYIDIDWVNAHPVILLHLCKMNNIPCTSLSEYIKNRDKHLTKTKMNRDDAKKMYLVLTNSDDPLMRLPTNHAKQYAEEMKYLHNRFAELYEKEYKEHLIRRETNGCNDNHKASFMNKLLCRFENDVLQEMIKYFGNPINCVLCFDGVMLPKIDTSYDIDGCIKHIKKKFEIDVFDLKEKPMTDILDLGCYKKEPYIYPSLRYYSDIRNLFKSSTYIEHITEWFENCAAYIDVHGSVYYYTINQATEKNNKNIVCKPCKAHEFEKTMGNYTCKVVNMHYDKDYDSQNPKSKDTRAQKYICDNMGFGKNGACRYLIDNKLMKMYYEVDYAPHLISNESPLREEVYNTFKPFPYDDGKCDTSTELFTKSNLYKHIKTDFCNNDKGEFNHLFDFIADIIQDPLKVKRNSHLFYSEQGCGKGLFNRFLTKLIGKSNVAKIGDPDQYFQSNFNASTRHKLLKIFEEVSEKGEAFRNHNRLKEEITAETERCEYKGIDAYDVKHCARYIFFSNNRNTLYIENDDTRFTLHAISNNHANNKKYFKPIADEIDDDNLIKSAFCYFVNRKYDPLSAQSTYETDYKREQKMSNWSNGVKFIIEYIGHAYNGLINSPKISAIKLNDAFQKWCSQQGSRCQINAFHTQIRQIDIEKPSRHTIGNVRIMCYIIDPIKIRQKIRDFLKNEKWDYDFEDLDHVDEIPQKTVIFNKLTESNEILKNKKKAKAVKKQLKINICI